ncbi:MAG: NADP-dependent oxidoreductase [Actinomycetota bacterium]|jgi:NADPH-dependent curcumin reductase|nr:NADP-dependent oxidoreductase [Actinomycetota bacterium]
MAEATSNTRVLFVERPRGAVDESCFEIDTQPIPEPAPGEVLVRNVYLSCDPYLRGRMDSAFDLGGPVTARVVGQVAVSGDPGFEPGQHVWGFLGWEQYSLIRGAELTPVDPEMGPLSHAISVRGMPGLTAWVGLVDIGKPQPGDTVYVSSATGAVGQVVGQLARRAGARVVGSGGTDAKVAHAIDRLGYHAAFNYKTAGSIGDALAQHCPDGIDVYFDNVGGETLEAVLGRVNPGARIPVCGMISRYESSDDPGVRNLISVLANRVTITGFSIYDHVHRLPWFVPRMARWLADGSIVYDEDMVEGIEALPGAFLGMLAGDNVGKRMVRVGPDST